jgi:hypothetical protein
MGHAARRSLAAFIVGAILLAAGCSGRAGPSQVAGADLGPARIPLDSPAVADWVNSARTAVGQLLTDQDGGTALLEPSTTPDLATWLAAALLLDHGQAPAAASALIGAIAGALRADGLASTPGAPPIDRAKTTWLAARWLTSHSWATLLPVRQRARAGELRRRLLTAAQATARRKQPSDADHAAILMFAIRTIQELRPGPQPFRFSPAAATGWCWQAAAEIGRGSEGNAAVWAELAKAAGHQCFALPVPGHEPSDPLAEADGAQLAAATGTTAPRLDACRTILQGPAGPHPPTMPTSVVLACRDAFIAADQTIPPLGPGTIAAVGRQLAWRGALPDRVLEDGLGLAYVAGALRLLGYSQQTIRSVRASLLPSASSDDRDLDTLLASLVTSPSSSDPGSPIPRLDGQTDPTLKRPMAVAAVLLREGRCGPQAIQLVRYLPTRDSPADPQSMLRMAMVARAVAGCNGHLHKTADAALARLRRAATHSPPITGHGQLDPVDLWARLETGCLLGRTAHLSPAAVAHRLPPFGPSDLIAAQAMNLYAGLRSLQITRSGCTQPWWNQ